MRTLKIFALPSHASKDRVSGVDFARIIQPMRHLNGFEYQDVKFEVYVYDAVIDEKMDWLNVAQNFDLVYFNYTALPWEFAKMGLMVRKFNRKMILDLDDSLWNVMEDNPAFPTYKKGSEGIRNFTAICNEVDGITTTNRYLKNVIAHNTSKRHEQIQVFPNYIDLELYSHRSEISTSPFIKLLHFGSTTHFLDLQNQEFEKAIDRIFKEYPNVILKTVGAMIGKYKTRWGLRYENAFGDTDVLKWIQYKFPGFMDEADICVVPLIDTVYNKCKSSIKFLEMSSAVKPGVWQNIRQYQEIVKNGENGFLASTEEEWYQALKKLIDDRQLRIDMGKKAFETVEREWKVQDHRKDYAEYFIGLLTN